MNMTCHFCSDEPGGQSSDVALDEGGEREMEVESEAEEEDTHRCAKCNLDFTSLEEYVQHKMARHKLKVQTRRSLLFPICNNSHKQEFFFLSLIRAKMASLSFMPHQVKFAKSPSDRRLIVPKLVRKPGRKPRGSAESETERLHKARRGTRRRTVVYLVRGGKDSERRSYRRSKTSVVPK